MECDTRLSMVYDVGCRNRPLWSIVEENMVFKKQAAGTQRTLIYKVRLKPAFKDQVEKKLDWLRTQRGHEDATHSDLIRMAIGFYCDDPGDPRTP